MKNVFGNNISVTLFGESHGSAVGCVIDGLAPGIAVDEEFINARLDQRRAKGKISTPRKEADEVIFLSGIKDGYTEGTPVALMIKNTNTESSAYSNIENTPRPSHADYAAEIKYHGYQDKRGGGHFSGRLTAPIVAAGALIMKALRDLGIYVGTHIKSLCGICDRDFGDYKADIDLLSKALFPVLSASSGELMIKRIEEAAAEGDSVGGVLSTVIIGMPAGVGEPWFDSVESVISHAIFSIGGVKGIEFGDGFKVAEMRGSEANDQIRVLDGKIVTEKNTSGGVQGGITNGMPIIFNTAIKPTPSISRVQRSVNLATMENTEIRITGRHDPAIIHRARAVVDAMTAIAAADLLVTRYGTDYLAGGKR